MDEEHVGKPFVGTSGRFLSAILNAVGILRNACLVANICQYRPPDNDIDRFAWDGPEITEGLQCLKADLDRFNPNLCLLLGSTTLKAAGVDKSISNYRGTLFVCQDLTSPFVGRKCMASFHPAYCLRDYAATPVLRIDMNRAMLEAHNPELVLPTRQLRINETYAEILAFLATCRNDKLPLAFDVEGGTANGGITCCSLATGPETSVVIPFSYGGTSVWREDEEKQIWLELAAVLEDPTIPKILQNSLYDRFVMAFTHGIRIQGTVDDTMVKHWELYAEFEKNLGFLCSIYTKQPFYKDQRKSETRAEFWTYSALDSAVTHEINTVQGKRLAGTGLAHYRFNMEMLDVFLEIQLRGICFDKPKLESRVQSLNATLEGEQATLDILAGGPLNVNSPKQMKAYLYEKLKLPVVKKRKTNTPTADYETLLKLAQKYGNPALNQCITVRSLRKRISLLNSLTTDQDGRLRCAYNVVGTSTGRLSCYESYSGSGTNLQTIPKQDRDLFLADEGCYFFQCDLSGADGWTVAAHCAALGDSTMLEDYLCGIKPAKVLALMIKHGPSIATLSRSELKERTYEINPDTDDQNNYIYFISKCAQHGTNYDMGPLLLAATVFKESEGLISVTSREAEIYQTLYRRRYCGIRRWHSWVQEQVCKKGYLVSASGNVRQFFGRKDSHDTHKAAYAHEPQNNTTYATNKSALWLFRNPRHITLLHQVHDAVCGQFPKERIEEARVDVRKAFDFTMEIHGVAIKIPFEGTYGPSWGECKEHL